MKQCKKCKEVKALQDFVPDVRYKNGRKGECKACNLKYQATWRKADPEKAKAIDTARNHKRRKHYTYGDFTAADWNKLVSEYGAVCMKCGLDTDLTLDHVIPLSLLGEHTLSNAQILCSHCNKSKGARSCADYRPYLAFGEQQYEYEIPVGLYTEVMSVSI